MDGVKYPWFGLTSALTITTLAVLILSIVGWYKTTKATSLYGCSIDEGVSVNPVTTDLCGHTILYHDGILKAGYYVYLVASFLYIFTSTAQEAMKPEQYSRVEHFKFLALWTLFIILILFTIYLPDGVTVDNFNLMYGARLFILIGLLLAGTTLFSCMIICFPCICFAT